MKAKRKNSVPKKYRAYYIEPGLADYSAEGVGVVLVGKEALDHMAASFVGKPVVNTIHTDKEPEELFNLSSSEWEEFADGVVSAVGYDDETGWFWADMLVWDDETIKNIDENGFSVSCAYDVLEADGTGGTYHNVPYDEEVLAGEYLHMAIVDNPRYEKAWIVKNSLPGGKSVKIKFKKKALKNQETEKPEVEEEQVENMDGAVIELPDGKEIPLEEAMAAYEESKKMENGKRYNLDDEIEVDGESMSVKDFLNACGYEMENSSDEEEEAMENAESPQDEVAEEVVENQARKNSTHKGKNFNKVKKAVKNSSQEFTPSYKTRADRLADGKARYGSPVKQ